MPHSNYLDIIALYPMETTGAFLDGVYRRTMFAHSVGPMEHAKLAFEDYLGHPLFDPPSGHAPQFDGCSFPTSEQRTLGAITLASLLERAGLRWKVIDPGVQDLGYWRRRLGEHRRAPPRVVAISTTFITTAPWLEALCSMIRDLLPGTKILVGGYYYATNAKQFLSLDADACYVGEGEDRFVEVVRALQDERPLEQIRGLYLRAPDGTLRFTGAPNSLDLNQLAPVDWRLSSRIDPPVDVDRAALEYWVETQRGCVFKCEFCTYRTLSRPAQLSPERAAEAILAPQTAFGGSISLTDATATFPPERWRAILEALIARGGSRWPIWCYARVSDLDEPTVALMARAGVRQVFLGQESGDQRMLNSMRKGTRVDQVAPAVAALARHGVRAEIAIIHGFPGETAESLQASRALLATINQPSADHPTVPFCWLQGFLVQDLAQVSQRSDLTDLPHHFGYDGLPFTARQTAEAIIATKIALASIPHAPVWWPLGALPAGSVLLTTHPSFDQMFRWLKAVNRGLAVFLERDLDGRSSHEGELPEIRDQVLARLPARPGIIAAQRQRVSRRLRHRWLERLLDECVAEPERGPGALCRLILAHQTHSAHARLSLTARSLWRGAFLPRVSPPPAALDNVSLAAHAAELRASAIERARRVKLPVLDGARDRPAGSAASSALSAAED